MTKKDFKEKLKRGLGSAIIVLEYATDVLKFQDTVLWACLNYTGYEWNSEGSRGAYLYYAISNFEDKKYFEDAILNKFCAEMKDSQLFDQLADLLVRFAQDGSNEAREKLYAVYNELFLYVSKRKIEEGNHCYQRNHLEWLCNRLLSLDGIQAFKKIIGDLSSFYKDYKGEDPFVFDWFFLRAKDVFGKRKVEKYLEKNNIKYEEYDFTPKQKDKDISPTLEEAIADCKKPWLKNEGYAIDLLRNGNKDEIEKLTNAVIDEKDLDIKANMLKIFTWDIPFCGDIVKLIDYSKSENRKLRCSAFEALEEIVSAEAHDYAVELLQKKEYLDEGISILCKNYKKEDAGILTDAITTLTLGNNEHWHGAFSSVCKLIGNNKHAPKGLLGYLYNKTICSFCREYIVLAMDKRKMLTYELLQEMKNDSNGDIRAFAYKKIKNAKTEKYLVNLQFDKKDHFCIWATDLDGLAEDRLLEKNNRIISFATEKECRDYAANKKLILTDDAVAAYNLDNNDFSDDCSAMLDKWNIMNDAANSVDIRFEGNKLIYDDLYNKIFFGCNLPAIRRDGEEYIPIFSDEDKTAIKKIFVQGFDIIKNNMSIK